MDVEGLIASARVFLEEAVRLDQVKDVTTADKYLEGITRLLDALKLMADDDSRKDSLRNRISYYLSRVEQLKSNSDKPVTVTVVESKRIREDSKGFDYATVFGKCVEGVDWVRIVDPYIIIHHQMMNLIRFCELVVSRSPSVQSIFLLTSEDGRANTEGFNELRGSLKKFNVTFTYNFSKTLHDREIIFSNGYVVKIGRGLDYFKNPGKFVIGAHDLKLRPCKETTVDVFKRTV